MCDEHIDLFPFLLWRQPEHPVEKKTDMNMGLKFMFSRDVWKHREKNFFVDLVPNSARELH
jgi:hypothetical protein